MTKPTITLIGAGLAGSLLGIFLARRGFSVTLHERRPDMRKTAIAAGRSINLALANRGIHPLEQIGLMDEIRRVLIPMAGRMLHDEAGQLSYFSYGQRPEEVIYSVSRGGLNSLLMDLAEREGVRIQFEHNCRAVDFERNRITLHDEASGANFEESFEILIGTDGSASAVRAAIMAATGGQCREEPLSHGYKELSIAPGLDGQFRLEKNALHIWPRGEFMLIALPNPDGSFTLTLFLPNEGAESFASLTTREAVEGFFQKYFQDTLALLPDLVEQFLANPLGHLGTVRSEPWHYGGKALILGDAAHAVVPFHGQGMNCAFEDVSALDACLDELDQGWQHVFERLFALRKPNAEAIADMALENYVEMRATVRDPKFALKKQLAFELENRHSPRFIPRYSMVMFHRMPYAEAQRRGAIQETILDELVSQADSLEQVNFALAARLIAERL